MAEKWEKPIRQARILIPVRKTIQERWKNGIKIYNHGRLKFRT
jgi:hypothetical protein